MTGYELRIGNYYNSVKFNTPVRCTLSDLAELYHRCDGAALDTEIIDSLFKPISLNEEWLKKLGIKSGKIMIKQGDIELNYIKGGSEIGHSCGMEYYNIIGQQIKYVHQLQNLYFALTNTELEING